MNMKIGVGQMSSQSDKEANLLAAEKLIDEMAEAGVRFASLPEYSMFVGEPDQVRQNAETLAGPIVSRLREKARQHKIYLHPGSMPEKAGDKVYNTTLIIDPQGEIVCQYRKIHLFDVVLPDGTEKRESRAIAAGSELVTAEIDGVIFGVSICYDVRFPELYRRLTEMGAEVLLVPAAFAMQTGRDHWQLLLRARAVDNLCWVVAAAQWGTHSPSRIYYGRSMIVDPWGTVIAQAVDGVGLAVGRIDLDRSRRMRETFPVLSHHRPDIFGR